MLDSTSGASPGRNAFWLPIWAGLCASLVSIGLARFGYTPLIPSLIEAHWFSSADVIYLGAANLAGYLLGALLGRPLAARISNGGALRAMMLLVTLSFFACAFPISLSWFFGWRLMSGISGGAIMVLVAGTVLPHVPVARRGLASGAIFFGLGVGIAASGTLVPLLLSSGLQATWIGLGVLALVLTAASWFCWPVASHKVAPAVSAATPRKLPSVIYSLFAQYALMAVGLVPAMVFLVDYVARGLGAGAQTGAMVWVMYGIGAMIGPLVYGFLADHLGARKGIRLVLLVQAFAVGTLAMVNQHWSLALLAIVIGSFPPGIVPLALARVHELVPDHHLQHVAWSRATVSFASFQAIGGYSYSAIFNATGGHYAVLFEIAASAIVLALLLELGLGFINRQNAASVRVVAL
ncbi:MAG: YbfB/YjiJ family MFS transporter [Pseudomonas sp.]